MLIALAAVLLVAQALRPAELDALPGRAPRATVDISTTTKRPHSSGGFTYTATYHDAADPDADPPALRRIVIDGPRGTRSDTTVTTQCNATDQELKNQGESACPADSRIGSGWVDVRILGVGKSRFDTTIFNGRGEQIELVKFAGGGAGVARSEIHGGDVDGPVPTCLTGGQPPEDCPSDQVTILSQSLSTEPISVGKGPERRNYLTTPRRCPRTEFWRTGIDLHFADGTVDHVVSRQPCIHRRPHRCHHGRHCARHHDRPVGRSRY